MIEVMIAVAVIMVISAMAIVQMQPTVQQSRANAGMSEALSALRVAQSYAVSYRRFVQVSFPNYPSVGANQIQVTIKNSMTPNAGNDVIFATYALEGSVTFQLAAGMPDTPDAFGNSTAVNFGGVDGGPAAGMFFQPDGTFVNATGAYVNGSMFLGVTSFASAARAVTILGSTGRVKSYHGDVKSGWTQSF